MTYKRINIDTFLNSFNDALPSKLSEAANLLKARGRKCIFIETDRLERIISLQNQINELKQNTNI